MTQDRDLEQLLDQWFTEGPDEVADRVVDEAFDQIALMPRRRAERATRRITTMSNLVRWMAAAILIGLIGYVGLGGPLHSDVANNGVPSPSPVPSASPSPSPDLPEGLRHIWAAPVAAGFPVTPDPGGSIGMINLDTTSYWARADTGDNVQNSTASVPEPGRLVLLSTDSTGGCTVGDEGSYRWSLTPGGTRLTLELDQDPCALRASLLSREWLHVACQGGQGACLGDLESGTYPSGIFHPETALGADGAHALGALTYTVPAGWANSTDLRYVFTLKPQAAYAQNGADWSDEIDIFARPNAASNDATCQDMVPAPGYRELSRRALVAWVTKQPGIVASVPQAITVDGHAATWVDLSVDPTWTETCPGASSPSVGLYTGLVNPIDPGNHYSWGIEQDRERHIFLDVADGETLVIVISTPDKANFDSFVAEAMPIVESFQFAGPDTLIPSPAPQPSASAAASPAG